VPLQIRTLDDYRRWIDGYDVGIRYMDDHVGRVLGALDAKGVLDDLVIIVSSDHGENLGELNVYGDHQTADHITSRVPLMVRWPGVPGPSVDRGLHYQVDMAATVAELCGGKVPALWDGVSFAGEFRAGRESGRGYVVASQCAWSCQRAARWGDWICIRTYHDGLKDFPPVMLFNVVDDPHETCNVVHERPEVADHGLALIERWQAEMMETSDSEVDPLWTVVREGGPLHTRHDLARYCRWLRGTGRAHHAEALEARHGRG
jgi:arylsulfatase A-like enzyme